MQQAIASLLTFAESQEEVAARVLEPAARSSVHARSRSHAEGSVVASWNVPAEVVDLGTASRRVWEDATRRRGRGGRRQTIIVWTSPYAPFFGEEELRLLQTLGALIGLALDRVRLYQAEHEARLRSSARTR